MITVEEAAMAYQERKEVLQHRLDENKQFGVEEIRLLSLGFELDPEEMVTFARKYAILSLSNLQGVTMRPEFWPIIEDVLVSVYVDGIITGNILADKRRESDAPPL